MRAYLWVVPVLAAIGLFFSARWMMGTLPDEHIDLEVYRFGLEAWWNGGDVYGRLPATKNGDSLPFVYPPFALPLFSPLAILPFNSALATLFTLTSCASG